MTKKTNRVVEAILEIADDQLRTGLIDKAEHEKIMIRHGAKIELRTTEQGRRPGLYQRGAQPHESGGE